MPEYKLTYFNLPGRAEAARQILAYAGVDFVDHRIPRSDFPEIRKTMPFGKIPVLEVDGELIPESSAIMRYLAKQFGLAGKNDIDAAWVDAIVDQYQEYHTDYAKYFDVQIGLHKGDKEAVKKEFCEPARDKFFPLLVAQLKKTGSGFLVGDSLTFVDILIAEHVATLQKVFPGFLEAFPEVLDYSKKIQSIPRIKAWIEKRPKSTFYRNKI